MTQSPPVSISFQDAIKKYGTARRILLLGNGFSSAVDSNFKYRNLYDKASKYTLKSMSEVDSIFRSSNHKDFERVSHDLQIASEVLQHYKKTDKTNLADKISDDKEHLAKVLVETINGVHPKQPDVFDGNTEKRCQEFLSHFIGKKAPVPKEGEIYTLNYDLLLYWVIIDALQSNNNERLKPNDGFGSKCGKIWSRGEDQNVFFLHGNLCLRTERNVIVIQIKNVVWGLDTILNGKFPQPVRDQVMRLMRKGKYPLCAQLTSCDTMKLFYTDDYAGTILNLVTESAREEKSLLPVSFESGNVLKLHHIGKSNTILKQVKKLILMGKFPLFVSDGSAVNKLIKIQNNAYLESCYDRLKDAAQDHNVSLFIFGCSLDPSDGHIWDVILNGKCKVFCSTYGTPSKGKTGIPCTHCNKDEDYPSVMDDSRLSRRGGPIFFCAESAKVWG